jgi:hypothetical protein
MKNADLSALWLSPFVVAARLPIIWYETLNPDPSSRDETNRMVVEKFAAAQEGLLAAQFALSQVAAESLGAVMFGKAPQHPRSAARQVINAGLAPAARRVKANHKRLRRQ